MKKFILSSILSIIGFIGFSNAGTLNCSGEGNLDGGVITCSPSSINSSLTDEYDSYDFTVLSSNLLDICNGEVSCEFNLYVGFDPDFDINYGIPTVWCSYPYDESTQLCSPGYISYTDLEGNDVLYLKGLLNYSAENPDDTVNLNMSIDYSVNRDPNAPDVPGTGGNENPPVIPDSPGEGGNGGNIVPDGSLVAVITGVFSVFGELIPYVVYIGIGILIVTVGFYAIRRLVNWLSDKIHNNFKF